MVNTLFTIAANGLWDEINALFIAGLLLVIAGAAIVLVFAPRGASPPKSKPEPKPVPAEPVIDAPPKEKAGGL